MSTSQTQSTKTSRRSGKKPRQSDSHVTALPSAGSDANNTTPTASDHTKNNPKAQPRRPSHVPSKQQENGNVSDRGRHISSHHEKAKATPVKQAAYAGSTFQQSPAASALPMPSFYSKSLPTGNFIPPSESAQQPTPPAQASVTPPSESPSNREATPCDFLFEAARKAKATPRGESPANLAGNLSVPTMSPASRSPGPREGDSMFPFELEGASIPGEDGSSFATPYKDRMAALRPARSTSQGIKSMDENERRAKTDALKKLLMKSTGDAQDQSNSQANYNNPFNARPPNHQGAYSTQRVPARPNSNPPPHNYFQEHQDYHQPPFPHAPYHHFPPAPLQTPKRPASSGLRNVYGAQSEPEYAELSSDNAVTPPTSTRKQSQQSTHHYAAFHGQPHAPQPQIPTHRAKPSAQQLEDDLRRVLKLDLTSRG